MVELLGLHLVLRVAFELNHLLHLPAFAVFVRMYMPTCRGSQSSGMLIDFFTCGK